MKSSKLKLEKLESGSYKTADNRFWVRDTYCPGYALPDNEVADYVMSDRVIKDFCLRPSAYNLTPEQKLAIAKILRG